MAKNAKRAPGTGTMKPLGVDKWLLRVNLGTVSDASGKPKRSTYAKVFHGKTSEAQRELTKLLQRRGDNALVARSGQTVKEYADLWLAERKKAQDAHERTLGCYTHTFKQYIYPYIGARRLEDLDAEILKRWQGSLTERGQDITCQSPGKRKPIACLSPRTRRLAATVLNMVLREAVYSGILVANPLDRVKLPKRTKATPRVLTTEDMQKVLEMTAEDVDSILWRLLLTSGMRPGEALALTWAAVNLEAGAVRIDQAVSKGLDGKWTVFQPKTEKSRRTLSLPKSTVEALRAHKRNTASLLVFPGKQGRYRDPSAVSKKWKRMLAKAKIPHLKLYGTRHSHITALLEAGVDLKHVSERAGHSSVSITGDIYAAVLPESHRKMAETMELLITSKKKA